MLNEHPVLVLSLAVLCPLQLSGVITLWFRCYNRQLKNAVLIIKMSTRVKNTGMQRLLKQKTARFITDREEILNIELMQQACFETPFYF